MRRARNCSSSICSVALGEPLEATFSYQPTDPATNAVVGQPNIPIDVPAGQSQTFVLAITPTAMIPPTDARLRFSCADMEPARSIAGVDTLQLSASNQPAPDLVALVATLRNDGVMHHFERRLHVRPASAREQLHSAVISTKASSREPVRE